LSSPLILLEIQSTRRGKGRREKQREKEREKERERR